VYCISGYEPANCNKKIKLPGWNNICPAKEISMMEQIEIRDHLVFEKRDRVFE
jgi:hypothetical protein